jgi:signal transduction histidine kinase
MAVSCDSSIIAMVSTAILATTITLSTGPIYPVRTEASTMADMDVIDRIDKLRIEMKGDFDNRFNRLEDSITKISKKSDEEYKELNSAIVAMRADINYMKDTNKDKIGFKRWLISLIICALAGPLFSYILSLLSNN